MFWHGENSDADAGTFGRRCTTRTDCSCTTAPGEWIWRPLAQSDARARRRRLPMTTRVRLACCSATEISKIIRISKPRITRVRAPGWNRSENGAAARCGCVEIPTAIETDDNVVAFWVPEKLPAPGEPIELEYRLHWFLDQITPPGGIRAFDAPRQIGAYEPGIGALRGRFRRRATQGASARRESRGSSYGTGSGGKLHHSTVQKNPINGTLARRVYGEAGRQRQAGRTALFLRRGNDTLTETWTYLWQP